MKRGTIALAALALLTSGCYPGGRVDPWAVNLRYSLGDGAITGPELIELTELGDLTERVAVVEVTNTGQAPHQLRIIALDPGENAATAAARLAGVEDGESPAPWGGTAALAPGGIQLLRLRIDNGRYALMCLERDSAGHSHSQLGELREVRTG